MARERDGRIFPGMETAPPGRTPTRGGGARIVIWATSAVAALVATLLLRGAADAGVLAPRQFGPLAYGVGVLSVCMAYRADVARYPRPDPGTFTRTDVAMTAWVFGLAIFMILEYYAYHPTKLRGLEAPAAHIPNAESGSGPSSIR